MPLSASRSGMAIFPRHVSKRPRFESTTVFTPNKRDIHADASFIWWGKVDSNHRRHCQQIYSLSHLATLEFPHINLRWSWWTDSNPRPADYKSAALPAELHQHLNRHCRQPLRICSAGFRPLSNNSKTGTICQQLFSESGRKILQTDILYTVFALSAIL